MRREVQWSAEACGWVGSWPWYAVRRGQKNARILPGVMKDHGVF
jgi:hypothetical protein